MDLTFYDASGEAVAYLDDDGESIYLYYGTAAGFLSQDSLYVYSGRHLGWLIDGWVRDPAGDDVYFTNDASGVPL